MSATPSRDSYDHDCRDLLGKIDHYGYTVIVVGTGECSVPGCTCPPDPYPYAYSLGMFQYDDHPEVVVFGLPLSHVNAVVDPVYEAAAAGRPLAVGREHRHRLASGASFSLLPVPGLWVRRDPGRIGWWFNLFGGHPVGPPFVQVCWADRHGRMPWDIECELGVAHAQPVLEHNSLRYPRPPRQAGRHNRGRHR